MKETTKRELSAEEEKRYTLMLQKIPSCINYLGREMKELLDHYLIDNVIKCNETEARYPNNPNFIGSLKVAYIEALALLMKEIAERDYAEQLEGAIRLYEVLSIRPSETDTKEMVHALLDNVASLLNKYKVLKHNINHLQLIALTGNISLLQEMKEDEHLKDTWQILNGN